MTIWRRTDVWLALMLRDIATRGGESRLRYVIVMLEPFGQLAMMYGVFAFIDRKPDFGRSLFVFLASGVVPYFLFTHVASRVGSAVRGGGRLRASGRIVTLDQVVSRFVLESLTVVVMAAVTFGMAALLEVPQSVPVHPMVLVIAFVLTAFLAMGVGVVNGVLSLAFGAYAMIWSIVARSLIFFSGVFYAVDYLPPRWRVVLSLNPVLHGTIMFRAGVYDRYPVATLDIFYLCSWVLGVWRWGWSCCGVVRCVAWYEDRASGCGVRAWGGGGFPGGDAGGAGG